MKYLLLTIVFILIFILQIVWLIICGWILAIDGRPGDALKPMNWFSDFSKQVLK